MAQSTSIWTRRRDLIFEGMIFLDASGNYGPNEGTLNNALPGPDGETPDGSMNNTWWYSSEGIGSIRVAAGFNGLNAVINSFTLQESTFFDGSSTAIPFRSQPIPVVYPGYIYVELDLTARYFQFQVNGGTANANQGFNLTVRAIPYFG